MQRETALKAELDTAATAAPDTTETDYNPFAPETGENSLVNPPQVQRMNSTGTTVHDKPPLDTRKQQKHTIQPIPQQSQSVKTPQEHAQNSTRSDLTQETIQGQGQGKQNPVQSTTAKRRRTKKQIKQDAEDFKKQLKKQPKTPDTLALRHDKPNRLQRIAFSPMPTSLAEHAIEKTLMIAQAAGVDGDFNSLDELLQGVAHLSPFAPERAGALLFSLATGSKHRDAFIASGLNHLDVCLFKRVDDNFSKLYDFAKRLQGDNMSEQVLDAAMIRAVDGVDVPMLGRVDKDTDGIITTRKVYSDKLAETILKATDKRFRDDPAVRATSGGVVYHIQVGHLAVNRPATSPIPAEVDGKRAEKTIEAEEMADLQAIDEI